MPHYLISFPSGIMDATEEEMPTVAAEANAVIRQARDAGVFVFGGGLLESTAPVRVSGDGTVSDGPHPQHSGLSGGMTVLDLPTRADAIEWAARIAVACRCPQELREFMPGSDS